MRGAPTEWQATSGQSRSYRALWPSVGTPPPAHRGARHIDRFAFPSRRCEPDHDDPITVGNLLAETCDCGQVIEVALPRGLPRRVTIARPDAVHSVFGRRGLGWATRAYSRSWLWSPCRPNYLQPGICSRYASAVRRAVSAQVKVAALATPRRPSSALSPSSAVSSSIDRLSSATSPAGK